MAKVKIKPTYPDTPSWADLAWRYSYTTIDMDFMEEFMIPSKADFTRGYPLESYTSQRYGYVEGQGDMEDLATTYRMARDMRLRAIGDYHSSLLLRKPLEFQNFSVDLWGDSDNHELFRFQFPAKDGSMNFPEWRVVDSEFHIMFANHPYREAAIKVMFEATDVKNVIEEFFINELVDNNGIYINDDLRADFRAVRDGYSKQKNEKSVTLMWGAEWTTVQEDNLVQLESDYLAAKQAYLDGIVSLFDPSITLQDNSDIKGLVDFFSEGGAFEILPSVKYGSELGAIIGSTGKFVYVQEFNQLFTWNAQLNEDGLPIGWEWQPVVDYLFDVLHGDSEGRKRAQNELILSLKPFTFAAHHMPAMRLFSEIQGAENRVIVDDYAAINAAMNAANAPA